MRSISAGTVHALLAGAVVAEISKTRIQLTVCMIGAALGRRQTASVTAFKGLDVIVTHNTSAGKVEPRAIRDEEGLKVEVLADSPLFTTERMNFSLARYTNACDGTSFQVVGCFKCDGTLAWSGSPLTLRAVRFALLPAILGGYELRAGSASTWLRTYIR